MTVAIDITGQRYGRLVAQHRAASVGRVKWVFACDCGVQTTKHVEAVRAGLTQSCGCLRRETTRSRSVTHGHSTGYSATRTLRSYHHAKARCLNPNDAKYPHYGGRGITMCSEWLASFEQFLADMGECPPKMTLDRVDVNGHYEPRNCRWATSRQQARTRRNNILVEHEGRKLILSDFAAVMGVSYKSLHARVKYGGQTPHEAAAAMRG